MPGLFIEILNCLVLVICLYGKGHNTDGTKPNREFKVLSRVGNAVPRFCKQPMGLLRHPFCLRMVQKATVKGCF